MTLTADEVTRLRSLHDRLDMKEVEDIYLPISRLLSLYVAAAQRLFIVQQHFSGTAEAKVPYIIGVAGTVAVGKSTTARVLQALLARWPNGRRSISSPPTASCCPTRCSSAKA
jgi:type I pantothenate kinase